MNKTEFEVIAEVILRLTPDVVDGDQRQKIAWRFADMLAKTNQRFDRVRFLKAAGAQVVAP